jgi:hypothetical protein
LVGCGLVLFGLCVVFFCVGFVFCVVTTIREWSKPKHSV